MGLSRVKFFFCIVGIAFLLSGCSCFQSEECDPLPEEIVTCAEEPLYINLNIVDKRWCKDSACCLPRQSIYLKKDLAIIIKKSVIDTFEGNNFFLCEEGARVDIEIEQFFCDLLERRSSWNCVSEILFQAKVTTRNGDVLYDRRISGLADNDFEKTERNGKSRKALETALKDAMDCLLSDRGFHRSVKRASQD